MTFILEYELLTEAEVTALFKPQIDAAKLAPAVAWLNRFDMGDGVAIPIKHGTEMPSARELKRTLNMAAKFHQAGVKDKDGARVLHANPDGTPKLEPVVLKWKTTTHIEKQEKNGKTADVTIIDRLSLVLAETKVKVTQEAAPPNDGPPSTPSTNGTDSATPSSAPPSLEPLKTASRRS